MSHVIDVTPIAAADLDAISLWIDARADAVIADRYDARIRWFISKLAIYPNRGTDRGNIGAGLRSVTFEGRIIVVYRVDGDQVDVVRVAHGARDTGTLDLV